MTVDWGTGSVEYREGLVFYFENDGKVWYDASKGIEVDGWREELAPYEGAQEPHPFVKDKKA